MEARRETKNGKSAWWHLHWPRDERIWKSPKILSVQMGARPTFALGEQPVYVPFSANVFVSSESTREDVRYILALLNSRLLWEWYKHHAKARGIGLEINGHVLGETPIRRIDFSDPEERGMHNRVIALVARILELKQGKSSDGLSREESLHLEREIAETDAQIDNLVYELYGITDEERKIIEAQQ